MSAVGQNFRGKLECLFGREASPSTLTDRMDFLGGEAYGGKETCTAADGHGLQTVMGVRKLGI